MVVLPTAIKFAKHVRSLCNLWHYNALIEGFLVTQVIAEWLYAFKLIRSISAPIESSTNNEFCKKVTFSVNIILSKLSKKPPVEISQKKNPNEMINGGYY